MNPTGAMTEEFLGSTELQSDEPLMDDNIPQSIEGLLGVAPPPFLSKTYDFVDDPNSNHVVSWSRGNNSFVVWDPQAFAMNLLPRYFKHKNFSSFVRQLNTYGFKKVDPDKWEFANERFLRGQRHLLKNIKRRKNAANFQAPDRGFESCVEVGIFGMEAEIDRLRRDKKVLTEELVKLRRQQESTNSYLKEMEQKLKGTELKQQQTLSFLAKAMKNPTFLQQIVLHKDRTKRLEKSIGKKRRKRIDLGSRNVGVQDLGQGGEASTVGIGDFGDGDTCVKLGSQECGDFGGFDVELERLAMNMEEQFLRVDDDVMEKQLSAEKSFNGGFWGDYIINEGMKDEMGALGVEGRLDEEVVDVFSDQLGFLGSSPR